MAKSKAITFKLPMEEYFLVSNYAEYENISLSEFLTNIVNNFLLIDYSIEHHNRWLVKELKDSLKIKRLPERTELEVISVRINRSDLNYWDVYCEHHFIPRTSLIRQAISNFFYPNGRPMRIQNYKKLEKIIYNLILGTGAINYNQLALIFKDISPKLLNEILYNFENNGFVGQKGDEFGRSYVPTTESEKSIGPHFLGELLSRLF